ncbi:hypothetical protein BN938_1253 [Mucinivorans hirudinis]|uniref:DNA-binding protein in cluster with Type I restriction-modification system n=1 Tax=Mucinivorans hirudinis TaxID=1433126 RepID=A0A060R7Q6_9BACT|nr:hypothetical protein BN938_1253 [Mucinivorans hirudinis]
MERGKITIENGTVEVVFGGNTVWLSQWQIAELFNVFVSKITANTRSILKSGALRETEVMRTHKFDGGSVELYNLEMITALAFRIDTPQARAFRHWALRKMAAKSVTPHIVVHCSAERFLN